MKHSATATLLLLAILGPSGCDNADQGSAKPAEPESKPAAEAAAKAAAEAAAAKADEAKADEAKADEAKADEAKADEAKADAAKADEGKADEAKADEAKADEPEADPDAAAAPLTNAAVFVVRDKGVVVLSDAGFTTLPGSASVFIQKLAQGADGQIFALTSNAIFALRVGKLERVAEVGYDTVGSVSVFDVDDKGTFWAAGSKGVSHYADGAWTTESIADIGIPDTYFTGLAIDGDGLPWVATSKALAHRVEGGWTPVELSGSSKTRYHRALKKGPGGSVFLTTMDKLYRLNPSAEVIKVKKPRYSSLGDLAFSQAGLGAIETGTESVAVFLPPEKAASYTNKKDYTVGMTTALAVDDQGRVWVAGDPGIAILGPGAERVSWRSGSMADVAGQISAIMVVGAGPTLPDAGAIKKGGLKGQIIKEGAGVAGMKVELCESPSMFYSRTPCTGAATHFKGETDADGNFAFADVPLGAYGVAVKAGKKWQITLGAALGSKMTEGETFDVGSIELNDDAK